MRAQLRMALGTATLVLLQGCGARRVTVPIFPPLIPTIPTPRPSVLWSESFEALDPARWREVELRHRTRYEAVEVDGRRCLFAESRGAASILLAEVRFDPDTYEWLSWDWRVEQHVAAEALDRKEGSDVAARVYVYFESGGLPWQKRNLDYVWSATLPVGAILASAFSAQSKILVVESGPAAPGAWRHVERNLEEDYERCFGEDPPRVLAIGIMTDTDNTGGEARAYFDELRVSRLPAKRP